MEGLYIKVKTTEGKPQEYDIETAEDIQEALKDLLGGTIRFPRLISCFRAFAGYSPPAESFILFVSMTCCSQTYMKKLSARCYALAGSCPLFIHPCGHDPPELT